MPDQLPRRIWILDTSSAIGVRELVSRGSEKAVLRSLGDLIDVGDMIFPREVLNELERQDDDCSRWAKGHAKKACAHDCDPIKVQEILTRVPLVVDTEKTIGVEEADPYVVTLAVSLVEAGSSATVVTEDRKDKPRKMSLATACGLWGIPTIPLEALLRHLGIWSRKS